MAVGKSRKHEKNVPPFMGIIKSAQITGTYPSAVSTGPAWSWNTCTTPSVVTGTTTYDSLVQSGRTVGKSFTSDYLTFFEHAELVELRGLLAMLRNLYIEGKLDDVQDLKAMVAILDPQGDLEYEREVVTRLAALVQELEKSVNETLL